MRLKNFFGATLAVIFILGLAFPGFSMYVGNYSEKGFEDPGTESGTMAKTSGNPGTINDLIIRSATFFLQGKANVDLLASRLEGAEHDGVYFFEYQMIVDNALENMRMARYYYQLLKIKADKIPYNQKVTDQLKTFDYKGFSIEYMLNSDIFNQVRNYLGAGDVRGVYNRFLAYTEGIINILESVQKDVYGWNFPDKSYIWRLNQECAHMLLFGQYVAQVFYCVH